MKDEVSVNSLLPKPESGLTSNGESVEEPLEIASRAYQLEMFQQSLQQNIIVAVCYHVCTCICSEADRFL